jgi:HSP20 family protein
MIRWTPFQSRLGRSEWFEDPFFGLRAGNGGDWGLPLDVAETDDNYVVTASIPGIDPDDLDITITDNVMTIRGERRQDENIENERYVLRERRHGMFARSIRFPVMVDADQIEASCDKGILTVALPKAETVKPRRINIGGRRTVEGSAVVETGSATTVPVEDASRTGWPEGQRTTGERAAPSAGWAEGQKAAPGKGPASSGWDEGQQETFQEPAPTHGWTEGQTGSSS